MRCDYPFHFSSLPLCGEGGTRSVTGGGLAARSPSGALRHLPRKGEDLEFRR